MKFETINRKFTEKVAEYMAQGWYINSATMSGHQGEISKIDLTNGTDIIRVLLTNESNIDRNGEKFYHFDYIALIVGQAQAENHFTPNSPSQWDTIWNERLDILYREEFYEIGERRSGKWYGTKAEAMAQQDKHWARYRTTFESQGRPLGEAAKEIVLPFVRRQPKCKTAKASEIERVTKQHIESRTGKRYVKYTIAVRGQVFDLH